MATKTRTISVIPGDGIGPEVLESALQALKALKAPVEFERREAGSEVVSKFGTNLPQETIDSIARNGAALKGPTETGVASGLPSANVALRKALDLFASLRPAHTIAGIKTRYDNVDLVVVRENTEDLYSGLEHIVVPGVVESLKIITERASLRIAKYAFEFARREQRKKVTAVHKANIMKLSDGLFLECCRRTSREFSDIAYEEVIVDNLCLQLVRNPERYDVLLLENLYGDIVSDLCAGLVGGLGVVPGGNIGDRCAVFEAVHGTAPDIAGKGLANPTAMLLSTVMLLRWLQMNSHADKLEKSVLSVLAEGKIRTRDLGGNATTAEFTQAVIRAIA